MAVILYSNFIGMQTIVVVIPGDEALTKFIKDKD